MLFILGCVDGDTCTGRSRRGIHYTLRLEGIDATETSHNGCPAQVFSNEAKKRVNALVKEKWLKVNFFGGDPYGRYIAQIESKEDRLNVNKLLIEEGYVYAYRRPKKNRPELDWAERAELSAQKNKKGLWALKKPPQTPGQFRKLNLNCRLQN
ncbi:thermonuclease family protein [bacterium]|nr:thermonuclease family protein [bacterium]